MKNVGWKITANYRDDMEEALEFASPDAVMTGLKKGVGDDCLSSHHKGWLIPFKNFFPESNYFTKPVKPKENDHKGKKSIRTAVTGYDEELAMLDEMEALAFMV